jgi:hypothetical protein
MSYDVQSCRGRGISQSGMSFMCSTLGHIIHCGYSLTLLLEIPSSSSTYPHHSGEENRRSKSYR